MNVWTYWEGPRPPWIQLCLETIVRNVPGVVIITPKTWPQFQRTDTDISGQLPNVKSDYIRAHQLHYYGGVWVDADAIVFRDLLPLTEHLQQFDFVAYRVAPAPNMLCTALIAGSPESDIGKRYLGSMETLLSQRRTLGPFELGPWRLVAATSQSKARCYMIPRPLVHPVFKGSWGAQPALWSRGTPDINRDAWCCMLTHCALGRRRNCTREELLGSDMMISHLFRRALA